MPLLPGTVRSQFIFRPISPERAAGGPAEENGKTARLDRLSPESDSGRSYSSRSRSESGSRRSEEGSRTPEEDMSRATTPGNTTELGGFLIHLLAIHLRCVAGCPPLQIVSTGYRILYTIYMGFPHRLLQVHASF